MSDTDDQWLTRLVKTTSIEALDGFVTLRFVGDSPVYEFREGQLWKSACSIKVWDDGRVHVTAEKHLTPRQRRIVAGLAQEFWRGGPEQCRREKWRRIRRSSARPVPSRAACFWVPADREDPGYQAAHADYAMTVQSDWKAIDSASTQALYGDLATT